MAWHMEKSIRILCYENFSFNCLKLEVKLFFILARTEEGKVFIIIISKSKIIIHYV